MILKLQLQIYFQNNSVSIPKNLPIFRFLISICIMLRCLYIERYIIFSTGNIFMVILHHT